MLVWQRKKLREKVLKLRVKRGGKGSFALKKKEFKGVEGVVVEMGSDKGVKEG